MLKKWLKNWRDGDTTKELEIPQELNTLNGLNLKKALDAHNLWKDKLQLELSGSSLASIDVTTVASDSVCELGKWLHTTGKEKFSKLPEFNKVLEAHKNFHLCAAEVVIEHQSGNTQYASTLLATKFRTASNVNQLELVRFFAANEN